MAGVTSTARFWLFRRLLMLLALAAWAGVASADSPAKVVRVEEDWELVVGDPHFEGVAPQITCVISPLDHVETWHAALELNAQSLPSFVPGGLQLQVWYGEVPLNYRAFPNPSILATSGETICWTQSVQLDDGTLKFEITDGSSSTWGQFGGQGYLKVSLDTPLTSLDAYHPDISVENSGISFAANRVQSLVLKRVRIFTSDGQQVEDPTERVVYPKN